MPVKINSIPLAPAPIVTFEKTYNRNAVGAFGSDYSITLNGTLIAFKGNPVSSGTTPTVSQSTSSVYTTYSSNDDPITNLSSDALLNAIMKKQESLRALFSVGQQSSGVLLEIIGYNENKGIKAYCNVESISFDDQSRWTNICGYTVNLTAVRFEESANGIFTNTEDDFSYYVSEMEDSWSIQENGYTATAGTGGADDQKKVYTVTRSLSATGKRTSSASALDNAKAWVLAQTPEDTTTSSYLFGSASNYKITETKNVYTGTYGLNIEYTAAPDTVIETITISIDEDLSSLKRVNINGTITGLNTNSAASETSTAYANALGYWSSREGTLYTICNSELSGPDQNLNEKPLSKSIGKNPTEGIVTYSVNYDNRPANIIIGALGEDIQVQDTYPGQIINVVPVIGRSQPIIQYLNSRSEYKRSLQITANMPIANGLIPKPDTSFLTTIFNTYKPAGTKVYYSAPVESFNPKTGQYSYSIEWTYEQ